MDFYHRLNASIVTSSRKNECGVAARVFKALEVAPVFTATPAKGVPGQYKRSLS